MLMCGNDYVEIHSKWMLNCTADVHVCKDEVTFTTLQKERDFGHINFEKKTKSLKLMAWEELI